MRKSKFQLRGWFLLFLTLLIMVGSGVLAYRSSFQRGTSGLTQTANTRLDLFASVLESRVKRLEPIPATIGLHPTIVRLLHSPSPALVREANDYLARLNAHLGSEAIYVADTSGVVRSSSNPDQPDDSRIGERVAQRPYFTESLSGRAFGHFAIGSGGAPGYFVAHPIYDGASIAGVAVVKIELSVAPQTWSTLGAGALITDSNQVVILASHPRWLFTSLTSAEGEQALPIAHVYGSKRLTRFPLPIELDQSDRADDNAQIQGYLNAEAVSKASSSGLIPSRAGYLVLGRTLDGMDWHVLTFTSLAATRQRATVDAMGVALGSLTVVLLALYGLQRRRIAQQKLQARAMLEQVNRDLEDAVQRRTEELQAKQDALIHAGKMAVLGQLAAGITHELTQPLGGIQTLAGNAVQFLQRGQADKVQANLGIIERLVGQMSNIIAPLKGFAHKSHLHPGQTDVGQVLAQALFLFQMRIEHEGVHVDNACTPGQWFGWCDPNRLEQILLNLISNALDAMRECTDKRLTIRVEHSTDPDTGAQAVHLHIHDSGKGLTSEELEHIFEPFYTTKPSGAGLGLGLVICRDIAHEFGGELLARNNPDQGACFSLTIPTPHSSEISP